MDTRADRVQYFLKWLKSEFGVNATLQKDGIDHVLEWASKYIAVLLPLTDPQAGKVYFDYSRTWTDAYAGANALFDLGATLGEAIILNRPNLKWQMEWSLYHFPNYKSEYSRESQLFLLSIERDQRRMRNDPGSSYRRPLLANENNPFDFEPVFQRTFTYYLLMTQSVTAAYAWRNFKRPEGVRSKHPNGLKRFFDKATTDPSRGDEYGR